MPHIRTYLAFRILDIHLLWFVKTLVLTVMCRWGKSCVFLRVSIRIAISWNTERSSINCADFELAVRWENFEVLWAKRNCEAGSSAPRPGRFTPGEKSRYPLYRRLGRPLGGAVWTGTENVAYIGIRSPDLPSRSESLYRLNRPGPPNLVVEVKSSNFVTEKNYFSSVRGTDCCQIFRAWINWGVYLGCWRIWRSVLLNVTKCSHDAVGCISWNTDAVTSAVEWQRIC